MTLALPTLLLFTFASIASMFLSMSEGAVTCRLNGVCDDTRTSPSDGSTVCSNCKSCTFKNCCNKVYTSELTKCPIPGWRAKGYKGTFPVDITAPKKRDVGCSKTNRCPDGSKCVAYTKGGDKGFCWKAPGLLEKTLIALAAVAGLFIFQ
uniref:Secreted protein n=1 Tax=Globodera pallida TaxID=36090 RepID=A0A183C8E1_GLOPA